MAENPDPGLPGQTQSSHSKAKSPRELEQDSRKGAVRVLVTYLASGFLFVVGAGFVGTLLVLGLVEDAKNVFLAILPVAAAIVTFWFAGRNNQPPDIVEVIKTIQGGTQ